MKCCSTLGNAGLLSTSLEIIQAWRKQIKQLIRRDASHLYFPYDN